MLLTTMLHTIVLIFLIKGLHALNAQCSLPSMRNQQLCYSVGGVSGRVLYDPVAWLSTRQRVGRYHLYTEQTSETYNNTAAPDISLSYSVGADGNLFSKKVTVNIEADAIWCSNVECTTMLDLVIDKNKTSLTALLQVQKGSYYGVSAAGNYSGYREHSMVNASKDDIHVNGTLHHYASDSPYTPYYATDALIVTNSVMRSLVGANIQKSYHVKTAYRERCGECTRIIYTGNPCTGWPKEMDLGKECNAEAAISASVVLPDNRTLASNYYATARSKAEKDVQEVCDGTNNCSFRNISSCLSYMCNNSSYSNDANYCATGIRYVDMYDYYFHEKIGTGVEISLKDDYWYKKTDPKWQQEWLKDRYEQASHVKNKTSEFAHNNSTYSGIEAWDEVAFQILYALRRYPSFCNNETWTNLMEEVNYLTTYYNCSYSTLDDTYEGLLGTSEKYRYCIPSDNVKYEYYSSPNLEGGYKSAYSLFDNMHAVVMANTSRCIRMNGNPPVRFCQTEGRQYLLQLYAYCNSIVSNKAFQQLASTTSTMTKLGYIFACISSFAGIIGAMFSIVVNCKGSLVQRHNNGTAVQSNDQTQPLITQQTDDCHEVDIGIYEIFSNRYNKRFVVMSVWFAYLSIVAVSAVTLLVDYYTEQGNGNPEHWEYEVVSQEITANAIPNEMYDPSYIYVLAEITVIVDISVWKKYAIWVVIPLILILFFGSMFLPYCCTQQCRCKSHDLTNRIRKKWDRISGAARKRRETASVQVELTQRQDKLEADVNEVKQGQDKLDKLEAVVNEIKQGLALALAQQQSTFQRTMSAPNALPTSTVYGVY